MNPVASSINETNSRTKLFTDHNGASSHSSANNNDHVDEGPDKTLDTILPDQFGSLSLQSVEPSKTVDIDHSITSSLQEFIRSKNNEISDKDIQIRALQSQLNDEKRRTLIAEQKTRDTLRELKSSTNDVLQLQKDLKAQANQIRSFKSRLKTVVLETNSTNWNVAVANIILMIWETWKKPSKLLQKTLGPFNGFATLDRLKNSLTVKDLKISAVFAKKFLVDQRNPWLSVGSGDCSFEAALISKMQRDESSKIVISPTATISPTAKQKVPDITSYIHSWWINAECLQDLSEYSLPDNAAILFNCPWATKKRTPDLLRNFMKSAATVQKQGSYLFLGITENSYYFQQYQLDELVANVLEVYTLEVVDVGIIESVLSCGYTHHSDSGKSLYDVVEKHVMLCFKRR
ncbi:hypothetical protein BC830DRAFT_522615 [Chytriomyces sp. MP71]|nr:hypothetical protein BC830DRAFT_522615 [Chytriomyces sp. MP71]